MNNRTVCTILQENKPFKESSTPGCVFCLETDSFKNEDETLPEIMRSKQTYTPLSEVIAKYENYIVENAKYHKNMSSYKKWANTLMSKAMEHALHCAEFCPKLEFTCDNEDEDT